MQKLRFNFLPKLLDKSSSHLWYFFSLPGPIYFSIYFLNAYMCLGQEHSLITCVLVPEITMTLLTTFYLSVGSYAYVGSQMPLK